MAFNTYGGTKFCFTGLEGKLSLTTLRTHLKQTQIPLPVRVIKKHFIHTQTKMAFILLFWGKNVILILVKLKVSFLHRVIMQIFQATHLIKTKQLNRYIMGQNNFKCLNKHTPYHTTHTHTAFSTFRHCNFIALTAKTMPPQTMHFCTICWILSTWTMATLNIMKCLQSQHVWLQWEQEQKQQ